MSGKEANTAGTKKKKKKKKKLYKPSTVQETSSPSIHLQFPMTNFWFAKLVWQTFIPTSS
jgi:hypothetical protein